MIASSIYAKQNMDIYPENIQIAIEYLKGHDFSKMEPGEYEIKGRDIYAQVFDTETAPASEKRPEIHRSHIDVQFLVTGEELLGYAPDTGDYQIVTEMVEKDIAFYKEVKAESFIHAVPGCFTIFFPQDVHRPAVMAEKAEKIRKVVVKVRTDI